MKVISNKEYCPECKERVYEKFNGLYECPNNDCPVYELNKE